MEISNHIKELCRARGWTYYKLALQCGIPQSSLNAMLNRDGDPSIKNLEKICKGLDITMTDFFDTTERKFAKVYLLGLACRGE